MHGTLHRACALAALAAGLLAASPAPAQQAVRLPEKDRPLTLRTTPVYAVGRADGREHEMFSRVDGVAFDRSDNLYVLDGGAGRVMVYDRGGRFVRQVGRKGGGPGEFMIPLGIAVQGDGTLAVADLGHRAYALFAADGRYLRSVPFTEPWAPLAVNGRMAAHPRGGVVATVRGAPPVSMAGAQRGTSTQATPILWQPFGAGAKAVPLFDAPVEFTVRSEGSSARQGQRTNFRATLPRFTPSLSWDLLPGGGMVVSHTPGYTLKVLDAGGRVARYVQKPMRVRRVTERDRERERERMREVLASGEGTRTISVGAGSGGRRSQGMSRDQIEQMVSEMRFGEVIPEIQGLRVDGAGRIWVARTGAVWGQPGPIDLVMADGRYLGTVTGQALPEAFSASGRAAYVETDDMGVQRVVVRQLPRL